MLEAGYYSLITHDVLYDKNLTANEKLLFACVTGLTKQRGYCYASNDYLAEKMNTSKRSISRWLNVLEKKGYIKRHLVYGENSKEVKERQIYTSLNGSEIDDKGSRQGSQDPHDTDDNTPHVTDGTDNSELINSKEDKELLDDDMQKRFEKLWKKYPKKKGKTKALQYYKKHIKEGSYTDETISKKIDDYVEEIKNKETPTDYIKHGPTFFNSGWEDEYETSAASKGDNPKFRPSTEKEKYGWKDQIPY